MKLIVVLVLATAVCADIYLHNPRGSNNRNRERSTNRNNANRLFDSQRYAWGPPLRYYEGSILPISWTNQHSCGGDSPNARCELIIQYMCGANVRDGYVTTTIPDGPAANDTEIREEECYYKNGNDSCTYDPAEEGIAMQKVATYGMHEDHDYWTACKTRDRNSRLFTADQNVGRRARNTRQNPGGTRHGFECAEERDYYPYWHPTPWRDIAVLTDTPERCELYRRESQNVKKKGFCSEDKYNNVDECEGNGHVWRSGAAHDIDPPYCGPSPWTRDNHLGNTLDGYTARYNWTIPFEASDEKWCVVRVRYNISTTDYDGWTTDYMVNGDAKSPVKDDPYVPYGLMSEGVDPRANDSLAMNLSLAIDTTQFGRTFQDRSHVFQIRSRPDDVPRKATIYNVNVRGKRGNIVQVYPAVEYDFIPNRLHVYQNEFLHFHWTGSNDNPQGNDGEGQRGTDRSNLVVLKSPGGNYPTEIDDERAEDFFGSRTKAFLFAHLAQKSTEDCLTLDELKEKHGNNNGQIERDPQNCMKQNAAGRDFDGGLIKIERRHVGKTFNMMSTRNNNFSNRSQKLFLHVGNNPEVPRWLLAIIAVLSVFALTLVVVPFALLVPTVVIVLANAVAQRL